MKLDGALRIFMRDREQFLLDANRRSQFLDDLSRQTLGESFVRFALPAGKLPVTLEVDAAWPPSDQEPIAPLR